MTGLSIRKISSKRWRLGASAFATCMTITERVYAAPSDPWEQAVQVLQTAFTGPVGTGLALVRLGRENVHKTVKFCVHKIRPRRYEVAR